ncbi:M56 family metallopeptidase [Aeoliella sp. ICT_H6.2]|uniref:M56 family metallopeptidase n=1 Tax=Aeoliella straminimaris TaxID=2954799 RepID=A0A9X2FB74_9BACT|nr:M56 family metallopeptidase [Aeoliella straminimaris]MCO6045324.1 M56 family metallopeptidase [Aeoliella straminimaris]
MSAIVSDSSTWAWYLVDVGCKSTILVCCALLIDRTLLHRRPLAADTLWSATVLVLGVLPVLCLVTPRIYIPVSTSAVTLDPSNTPAVPVTVANRDTSSDEFVQELPQPVATIEPSRIASAPADPAPVVDAAPPATETPNLVFVLVACYLAGVLFASLRLALSYGSVLRLRRSASPIASGPWVEALAEMKTHLGVVGTVEVYQSTEVSAPLTLGWRRPVVILPASGLEGIDSAAMSVVLLHELTHIARHDFARNLLARCVQCIYWYNPLMLMVGRRAAQLRELICDGVCVASLGNPDAYVQLLLGFAKDMVRRRQLALGLTMVGISRLEHRLENLMPLGRVRATIAWRWGILLSAVVLSVFLGTTTLGQLADDVDEGNRASGVTIDEVIAGLKKAESSIKTLAVNCDVEYEINLTEPGKPLPDDLLIEDGAVSMHRVGSATWEIDKSGAGRLEATYLKTNTRFDGTQREKREGFVSVFDGTRGVFETTISSKEGTVLYRDRRQTDNFTRTSDSPLDFSICKNGHLISELLTQHGGALAGKKEWDGRSLVVVDVEPVRVRDDYVYKQQFWVDPERNYLVVRRFSHVQRGEGLPWGLHLQIDLSSVQEVSPGIWLPFQVDKWNYHVTEVGQGHLVSREHVAVSQWKANAPIAPERLKLVPGSLGSIGEPISRNEANTTSAGEVRPTAADVPDGFRQMLVRAVDSQGKPVPGTRIHVSIWPAGEFKTLKRDYTSAPGGSVNVLVPDPPRLFRVWTQKEGYVPLFAQWWPEQQPDGDQIPNEFTFQLPAGTTIGGTIQDDQGEPIEGVMVEVMLANQVDERQRRPVPSIWLAESPGPGNNPCTTDAEGKWELHNVPAGDDIVVRLKLTHPDYISDYQWGDLQSEQGIRMESLREKSAVIVMRRGVKVSGVIRDAQQNPVDDAVVIWGDDPYIQTGSQEVNSDEKGAYQFAPLKTGRVRLTVVAPGWAPQTRIVKVDAEMGPRDFELAKGQLLRLQFVDGDGQPVPNVYVSIDRWRDSQALYNHRHPNVLDTHIPVRATEQGVYEWSWAPADAVDYAFSADGYRREVQSVTADGTTHAITLVAE